MTRPALRQAVTFQSVPSQGEIKNKGSVSPTRLIPVLRLPRGVPTGLVDERIYRCFSGRDLNAFVRRTRASGEWAISETRDWIFLSATNPRGGDPRIPCGQQD
jgi:hypothetical protein